MVEKNARFFKAPKLEYFVRKDKYSKYFANIDNQIYELNLLGKRAVENTGLAVEIFKYLVPDYEKYLGVLRDVNWPCRMEKIQYKSRDVFLSGDHNPQGIQSLMEILQNFEFENVHFVVGICSDKDSDQMIKMLSSIRNSHIYLTETPVKTLDIENYSEFVKSTAEFLSKYPTESLGNAVANASDNDIVVVTGSLYLTGFIKGLCHETN